MRVVRDAVCPVCSGSIRIVVDDGRELGASDGESMRATAKRIVDRHGGWKCDACEFRMGLTTEILDAIQRAVT